MWEGGAPWAGPQKPLPLPSLLELRENTEETPLRLKKIQACLGRGGPSQ